MTAILRIRGDFDILRPMIQKSDATGSVPQTTKGDSSVSSSSQKTDTNINANVSAQQNMFIAMTLSMSWQLALVVIVPIVGGHFLDEHYRMAPWLTLVGLVVAIIGVFGVLTRTVSEANRRVNDTKPEDKA